MISALITFILARPFGLQSLFQRLASAILGSHANKCRKEAKTIESAIVHDSSDGHGQIMCDAIHGYVSKTTVDERLAMDRQAVESRISLVDVIISNYDNSKPFTEGSHISPSASVPHLRELLNLLSTARDYDSLIAFTNTTTFVKIIKDTLDVVLYGPLTQWGKVCKLSDRVYDLQIFLTDLVETAKRKDVGALSPYFNCDWEASSCLS